MTPEAFQLAAHRGLHPRMARRRWLLDSLAAGYDVELAEAAGVDPDTIEGAQIEADERRARQAEAEPVTFAIARDQYNNPVAPLTGNRRARRAQLAHRRRLAKRRAKR